MGAHQPLHESGPAGGCLGPTRPPRAAGPGQEGGKCRGPRAEGRLHRHKGAHHPLAARRRSWQDSRSTSTFLAPPQKRGAFFILRPVSGPVGHLPPTRPPAAVQEGPGGLGHKPQPGEALTRIRTGAMAIPGETSVPVSAYPKQSSLDFRPTPQKAGLFLRPAVHLLCWRHARARFGPLQGLARGPHPVSEPDEIHGLRCP
jgi:hypothetical protein